MTASKVTVLPAPASGRGRREDPDPRALVAENERLRAENAVLRERLANMQAIALEREQRIEDLRHALQMLPSVWTRKLEEKLGASGEKADQTPESPPPSPASPAPPVAVPAVAPQPPAAAEGSAAADFTADQKPQPDRAEAVLEEVAALRARLERRRLEVEREMLEQERGRLLADLDWNRRWRRFRRAPASAP